MGLFDTAEPLDSRIATAMLTTDRRAQRALAKSQSGILAALDGDPAGIVAIDEITCDATLVAAHQRIHVYRKGGKSQQRVVDLTSISSAYTKGPCASLGGTGVSVTFRDQSSADKFKVAINRMIIASRHGRFLSSIRVTSWGFLLQLTCRQRQ